MSGDPGELSAQAFMKRKVLLLGDGAVGKTSLVRRFVVDSFSDQYIATIGTKVTKKDMRVHSGMTVYEMTLILWDILGQRGFKAVQSNSFMGSGGVVLVFDLTRLDTGHSLKEYWVPRLNEVSGQVPAVLFANKVDLVHNRSAAIEAAGALASELGCRFFLTSAKTGENVESGFLSLARGMIHAGERELRGVAGISGLTLEASTIDVADKIMVDFCNDFGGIEVGTPILKEQFTRAGLDIRRPTMDSLMKAIDLLVEVEKSFKTDSEAERTKAKWVGWLKEIKMP